jgi:hypothetical protein
VAKQLKSCNPKWQSNSRIHFAFAFAFEKKTAESGERLIIKMDCGFLELPPIIYGNSAFLSCLIYIGQLGNDTGTT